MENRIEEEITEKWAEAKIFEPSTKGKPKKFLITVPYPYVNGSLHVGHGKTYTVTDIIARYRRITGYNVLYPMAFHQSGTPLIAYSRRIKSREPAIMKTYRDYLSTYIRDSEEIERKLKEFEDPQKIADYFANKISRDFMRMGYSIDWTRSFASGELVYQDFVEWQFRKLMDKGVIVQKDYPILYSIEDGNAVGEDDIKDGDTDKVTIDEYTGLIFRGKEYSLIAATVRPETLYGVTNLWISPTAKYLEFRYGSEKFVVSSAAFDKLALQLKWINSMAEVPAEDICSQLFEAPMVGRRVKAIRSEIVDPEIGTGIVFSVPGHAITDYVAARGNPGIIPIKVIDMPPDSKATVERIASEYGINSVKQEKELDEATRILYREEYYFGRMNTENSKFSGMTVREAREAITSELNHNRDSIKIYETSRRAVTRSESRVVVAVLPGQWFIDYSSKWWKDTGHRLVDSIEFYPPALKKNMHDTIDWLRERPCARRRGLGTRLPFDREWLIESLSDSTIYTVLYTVINELREIREEAGKVDPEVLDYIMLDSEIDLREKYGEKVQKLASRARKNKQYWYPVDLRVTATPHFSNHLAFFIMHHCAIFPEKYWPRSLMVLGLVVSTGAKIGKSKGNAVSLYNTARQHSADVYRLAIAAAADPTSELEWSEDELETFEGKYATFRRILDSTGRDYPELSGGETWIISSFRARLARFMDFMEKNDIRNATVSIFYEVLNDLREAEKMGVSQDRGAYFIVRDWLIALSAIIPYASEFYWSKFGYGGFSSGQRLEMPSITDADSRVVEWKAFADKVIGDIREIIAATQIRPGEVEIMVAGEDQIRIAKKVMEKRLAELDQEYKRLIPQVEKARRYIDLKGLDEYSALKAFSSYISESIGTSIGIGISSINTQGKNAWPGRPLINIVPEK